LLFYAPTNIRESAQVLKGKCAEAVLILDDGNHAVCWSKRGQSCIPEAILYVETARKLGIKIAKVLDSWRVVAIGVLRI